MPDDRLKVVVRVEKRKIAMRPILAALIEALDSERIQPDVAEVMPADISKPDIVSRARSVAQGAVASAHANQDSILSVQIVMTKIEFYSKTGKIPEGNAIVIMIASMGPFSPLRLEIRADPSADVPKPVCDLLASLQTSIVKEIPNREIADWESGAVLSVAVTELIFGALFKLAYDHGTDDPTLQ